MSTQSPSKPELRQVGLWITLTAALVYCGWLGWHWLSLGYSDKELAGFVSRVWDIQRSLAGHHGLPWWTPWFMGGASYGLDYSHGLYLIPWLLLATMFSLPVAGKLCALIAIFAGTVAMYCCARYFLKNDWAATLAALVFLLHPEQIIRAAGVEQMTVIMCLPFIPLTWWWFARVLDTGKLRDSFWCSVSAVCLLGMDHQQALIQYMFLACYFVYWLWSNGAVRRVSAIRMCGLIAIFTVGLGAFFIVTRFVESHYIKQSYDEPVTDLQRNYAFKSLLALVDRDGTITRQAIRGAVDAVNARGGVRSQAELTQLQRLAGLQIDSPEKYAGLVLLAVLTITMLFNRDRVNRRLFWFFVGMLLVTVMLASGRSSVFSANWQTWQALTSLAGVPGLVTRAIWLALLTMATFLVLFIHRKLTTTRKRIFAGGALLVFLFLPAFHILAVVPFFKEWRAPFVFYDLPAVFFGALLAGFFVTDGLPSASPAKVVAGLGLLLVVDYWPYQQPMKINDVPGHTFQNLRATYTALADDRDWVKTYAFSGRPFHLLGPRWSDKPQVSETFDSQAYPPGMGLLIPNMGGELFNLVGARYVVFDKTDPGGNAQLASQLRQADPVVTENEDFVVFRNAGARPYLTAYLRACAYLGDFRQSSRLALTLSNKGWPLVQINSPQEAASYERVYAPPAEALRFSGIPNLYELHPDSLPLLPATSSEPVTLTSVQLRRESNYRIHMELTVLSPCTLVIAESYYPFWQATVDGKPSAVLRVNCGLMGLSLPAGQHSIEMLFRPPRAYAVAAGVSVLTLVAGLILSRRGSP